MKVKDLMTADAKACLPSSSLAEAAWLMWENDCGVVPVVTEEGKVCGLITDRDICMAATTQGRAPSNIAVEEIVSGDVFACQPGDDVHDALKAMREHKVMRLPVVAEDGSLEGILSMNDVVLNAKESGGKKTTELAFHDVVDTFKSICEHRQTTKHSQATAGS